MRVYPSKKKFIRMAETADLIPVYAEITADLETPVSAFMKLSESRYAYLLESVEGGSHVGRYSFLGFSPEKVIRIKGCKGIISDSDGHEEHIEDDQPLKRLISAANRYRLPENDDMPPFCGGAVGYLSYDCARYFESIPEAGEDELDVPDAFFMFAHRYLVFDRVNNRLRVAANATINGNPEEAYEKACRAIMETIEKLNCAPPLKPSSPAEDRSSLIMDASMTEEDYIGAVENCLDHIRKGDILQAVLSYRIKIDFDHDPFDIYRALRMLNPSPYMFYLKMGDIHMAGSSPETMVKVEGSKVTINPIAGTRPRGATAAEDRLMEEDLLGDEKEGAEHLMLVDLARNDLGRFCLPGTVTVSSFRRVEKYSHVMHLVSTVEGTLSLPADLHEVIRASFPAGTVSGAPKIKAMEIINNLEKNRRGPYAGLVGYLDYRGNMDSCITIRTIFIKDQAAYIQAGAGIVAASRPEREYLECRQKAGALLQALEMVRGGAL